MTDTKYYLDRLMKYATFTGSVEGLSEFQQRGLLTPEQMADRLAKLIVEFEADMKEKSA